MLSKKSGTKSAKIGQKSLLIYFIVIMMLGNQRQFGETVLSYGIGSIIKL